MFLGVRTIFNHLELIHHISGAFDRPYRIQHNSTIFFPVNMPRKGNDSILCANSEMMPLGRRG